MNSLILPVAGISSRYPEMRPKWLLTMPDGKLMIEKSVSKIDKKYFDRIIIVVLKKHLIEFTRRKALIDSLKKNISKKIELVELNRPTTCQAETVLNGIKKANIKGGIFIKDCDNSFEYRPKKKLLNKVLTVNLSNVDLIDAKNKSYVSVDKTNFVTNIIEKKIISNIFCCGGYIFESADDFKKYSSILLKTNKNIYISDVIYKMIMNNHSFLANEVTNYTDWGTLREFRHFQRKHLTIFCDLDGCLFYNSSKFNKTPWKNEVITKNVVALKKILNQKEKIVDLIVTTSRPISEKKNIIKTLKKHNIVFKDVITDLQHSSRLLINDFSRSNPYPSAVAINMERDSEELESIFQSLSN